jgi:predicted DNA-binding protein (MmcQ/YjbR family)
MPRPELLALRTQALAYPGAHEDFPWGERVVKVNKKVFVFLGMDDADPWGFSVKLPQSSGAALMLPFASPTGYGLGKAGWVSCKFSGKEKAPLPLLSQWLEESYRAVAPAKLLQQLEGGAKVKKASAPAKKKPAARAKPAKRSMAKRPRR